MEDAIQNHRLSNFLKLFRKKNTGNYDEVKTPYKYGLIMVPEHDSLKMDCPTVFRKDGKWYMAYFVFDGRGYETWLAQSDDLLNWEKMGKIMAFSDSTDWDENQKAGYPSLQDPEWGGSYELQKFDGKYWMPYFGGSSRGYERGLLSIGMAYTDKDPSTVHLWQRFDKPVFMASDPDARCGKTAFIKRGFCSIRINNRLPVCDVLQCPWRQH